MELPRRDRDDVHLPDGAFRERVAALREVSGARDLVIGIMYAFDFRTRMLPFWYADQRMAPCAVRRLGEVLHEAGFRKLRIVLQQWSPKVRPSRMKLEGRPLDILLVSSMPVHAEKAYALIRDAHGMGAARPLIRAGGPKAIHEPPDYFELGPKPGGGADCVTAGEAFVLLELLRAILARRRADQFPPRCLKFQFIGQFGRLLAARRLIAWAWRLSRGPIERYPGLRPARIPRIDAASGKKINWAIQHVPLVAGHARRTRAPDRSPAPICVSLTHSRRARAAGLETVAR